VIGEGYQAHGRRNPPHKENSMMNVKEEMALKERTANLNDPQREEKAPAEESGRGLESPRERKKKNNREEREDRVPGTRDEFP